MNTDKYDGHLSFTGDEWLWVWSKSGMRRMETVKQFQTTAKLLNDAPKLLAEVKRLREGIADIQANMCAADGSYLYGFIQELAELIE